MHACLRSNETRARAVVCVCHLLVRQLVHRCDVVAEQHHRRTHPHVRRLGVPWRSARTHTHKRKKKNDVKVCKRWRRRRRLALLTARGTPVPLTLHRQTAPAYRQHSTAYRTPDTTSTSRTCCPAAARSVCTANCATRCCAVVSCRVRVTVRNRATIVRTVKVSKINMISNSYERRGVPRKSICQTAQRTRNPKMFTHSLQYRSLRSFIRNGEYSSRYS